MNEDRSARYHRLRRRATVLSALLAAAWLVVLAYTPAGTALADLSMRAGFWLPAPLAVLAAVVVFVLAGTLGFEILSFPLGLYRNFLLERRYGLSSEPFGTWLADHAKAFAIGLPLSVGAGLVITLSHWMSEAWWWVISAAAFGLVTVLLAAVAPTLLMPLFYRFKPLEREALRDRLLELSTRAGVAVLGAFEWGLGEKTTRANAALVGIGRTRRIILSDTLLKDYSDEEVEVILAHELAHHVHHDIWLAVALEVATMTIALGVASLVPSPGSVVALAHIALVSAAVSLALVPLANAWSRHNERRADRFALQLTGRPAAFISAIRRLGAQNLAEERPSALARWLFHSHPTIEERVAAARRIAG